MRFPNKKIKSSALQFALYISVIITLLLFGLLLYIHSSKILQYNAQYQLQTIENVNTVLFLELSNKTFKSDSIKTSVSTEYDSKEILLNEFWGGFQKTTVISKIKSKYFKKTALLGSKYSENSPCLYLEDTQKPLVVVGNTKIEGIAYLPAQGVRPGTISGEEYYGNQLIYGNSFSVNSGIPKLKKEFLNYIDNLLKYPQSANQDNREINSFDNAIGVIQSNYIITLNKNLTGNIIVKSQNKIIVKESSHLKDVILVAPIVEVLDGVKGNFHIIASEKIVIGNHVNLDYPSSVITQLNETKLSEEPNKIGVGIGKFTTIKGQIILLKEQTDNVFDTDILIDQNSKITGEIYCLGNLELKCDVEGSVYARQFITRASGTIFINHLYNVKISTKNFPLSYGGIPLENTQKSIVKWLY